MGPDETAWIPIDDDSAIGAARRAATRMAERVHFDAERVGQIGLAVTEAATNLQRAGLIKYRRGHITVVDRKGLEQRTCECYSVVQKEYQRLLPEQHAI